METIELKPKPVQTVVRVFLLVFAMFYLAKHCAYGLSIIHDPEFLLILRARALEALTATATFSLVMAIPYFQGRFNILLTKSTLQAPMKKKRFGFVESSTVDLSDISINRSLRNKLIGTQVMTNDGQPIHIHSFIYNSKAISKLLDEIELKIETINNPNHNLQPTPLNAGDDANAQGGAAEL